MKLVSFNAGLQIYDLLKIPFFTQVPFLKERLRSLPRELLKIDADMLFLQEVYHTKHKKFLTQALARNYPYSLHVNKGYRISMENGLTFFLKILL